MITTFYAIEHADRVYVGETTNYESRKSDHKRQEEIAYQLLGIVERPTIRVLAETDKPLTKSERLIIEKNWSNHFRQFKQIINNPPQSPERIKRRIDKAIEYRRGKPRTEETKAKIRAALTGRVGKKRPDVAQRNKETKRKHYGL